MIIVFSELVQHEPGSYAGAHLTEGRARCGRIVVIAVGTRMFFFGCCNDFIYRLTLSGSA